MLVQMVEKKGLMTRIPEKQSRALQVLKTLDFFIWENCVQRLFEPIRINQPPFDGVGAFWCVFSFVFLCVLMKSLCYYC